MKTNRAYARTGDSFTFDSQSRTARQRVFFKVKWLAIEARRTIKPLCLGREIDKINSHSRYSDKKS